jgi:hypothetical protein
LSLLRDLHSSLAFIAVIFCRNNSVHMHNSPSRLNSTTATCARDPDPRNVNWAPSGINPECEGCVQTFCRVRGSREATKSEICYIGNHGSRMQDHTPRVYSGIRSCMHDVLHSEYFLGHNKGSWGSGSRGGTATVSLTRGLAQISCPYGALHTRSPVRHGRHYHFDST